MSSARAPVGTVSMTIVPFSPIFMIEPLPNDFSIWPRAMSSDFSRSTVSFPLSAAFVGRDPPAGVRLLRRSYDGGCDSYTPVIRPRYRRTHVRSRFCGASQAEPLEHLVARAPGAPQVALDQGDLVHRPPAGQRPTRHATGQRRPPAGP